MKILGILVMATAIGVMQPNVNTYPECGIITSIDDDLVTIEFCNGNEFQFYGAKDYEINDLVAVEMSDNGTKTVSDDEILSTKYVGYVGRFEEMERK